MSIEISILKTAASLLVKQLTKYTNDVKWEKERQNIYEDLVLELDAKWARQEAHQRPTKHDVKQAAKELKKEFQRSTNNMKRQMLAKAFFNRLDPEFYLKALDKILWSKVRRLEYPDVEFLDRLIKRVDSVKDDGHIFREAGMALPSQIPFETTSKDIEFATRLAAVNLVSIDSSETAGKLLVAPRGLARELRNFAYMQWTVGYEDEPSATPVNGK